MINLVGPGGPLNSVRQVCSPDEAAGGGEKPKTEDSGSGIRGNVAPILLPEVQAENRKLKGTVVALQAQVMEKERRIQLLESLLDNLQRQNGQLQQQVAELQAAQGYIAREKPSEVEKVQVKGYFPTDVDEFVVYRHQRDIDALRIEHGLFGKSDQEVVWAVGSEELKAHREAMQPLIESLSNSVRSQFNVSANVNCDRALQAMLGELTAQKQLAMHERVITTTTQSQAQACMSPFDYFSSNVQYQKGYYQDMIRRVRASIGESSRITDDQIVYEYGGFDHHFKVTYEELKKFGHYK